MRRQGESQTHFPPTPTSVHTHKAEEVLAATQGMRDGPPATFWDRVFENEINAAVHRTKAAYDDMNFRDVVLAGW